MVQVRENPLTQRATLIEAVKAIEISPRRMTVIVGPDGRLLGTLTDGDIRRHLLTGGLLEDLAIQAMNPNPITSPGVSTFVCMQDLMRKNNVIALPIVDENGVYLELLHLMDLISDSVTTEVPENTFDFAVIMAGGEGNRLRPLTERTPKPMIKIGDVPLLEHQIKSLSNIGIKRIYISVNYLGKVIEDYFGKGMNFGVEIKYLREESKLSTAGSLSLLPEIPVNSILVINGDIYTASDFRALYSFHKNGDALVTVGAVDYRIDIPYGVIKMNEGYLNGISEKPSQHYFCNAGIYAISPEALKLIINQTAFSMTDFINKCLSEGIKIGAFPIHEYWNDIGTSEDLEKARKKFLQQELPNQLE